MGLYLEARIWIWIRIHISMKSRTRIQIRIKKNQNPDPHQSDKWNPDPYQIRSTTPLFGTRAPQLQNSRSPEQDSDEKCWHSTEGMFSFLRVLSSAVITTTSCQLNHFPVLFSIAKGCVFILCYDSMNPVLFSFVSKSSSQHRFPSIFMVSYTYIRIKNHN